MYIQLEGLSECLSCFSHFGQSFIAQIRFVIANTPLYMSHCQLASSNHE